MVAIVGSHLTNYSRLMTYRAADPGRLRSFAFISGLAYGVDVWHIRRRIAADNGAGIP